MLTKDDVRNVFMTPAGERVLKWILYEHQFFNPDIQNEKQLALRNWAMKLLHIIGPSDPENAVDLFLKVAAQEPKDNLRVKEN